MTLTTAYRSRGVCTAIALLLLGTATSRAELLLERTVLPGAAPSSFAIGFPNGISFCYDPERGGIDYVWRGGFVDLAPVRPGPGKLIKPVELRGLVLYRETGIAPLRFGDEKHVPKVTFKGYSLNGDEITFRYTVDGAAVEEEIRLRQGGNGLVRHFRVDDATRDRVWWFLPGATEGPAWRAPSGQEQSGGFRFTPGKLKEFSLEIVLPTKSS